MRGVWPRGPRLEAIRQAAHAFRERFSSGQVIHAVRSVDIAAAPYPTRYALGGAAISLNPFVSIINRMVVVQFEGFDGASRTLVWEPTVTAGSAEAPFYARLEQLVGRFLSHRVFTRYYAEPESILPRLGLRPEDVDLVSFDHLHVQDLRMILGSHSPINEEPAPRQSLFPRARFVVQESELATLEGLHPMQSAWYVADGLHDARRDQLSLINGDIELGHGVAILWTPGHTDGNHSLAINTSDGVWVSSENGVSADNWQPELSRIPGVRRYAKFFDHEVILNANTLEDSIDQYDSMIKEKTVADASPRDPRWRLIQPSSELASFRRQWPVVPTFAHGGINYGTLHAGDRPRAARSTRR